MSNSISGKVILITGASSGIGEKTAMHLASKGARVVLGARRGRNLARIAEQINMHGGTATFAICDVTKQEDVEALAQKAITEYSKIDVIINNAGLMAIAPLEQLKVDEWERMVDINIKGVLYGISATLPIFKKQGFGHYINISSVAGQKVFSPGGSVYSATKFAVRALSEGLRHEVGRNIRTTCIEPGAVQSELPAGTTHTDSAEKLAQVFKDAIPSDAVAQAIAYAIEQPQNVDINEIALRPTVQEF